MRPDSLQKAVGFDTLGLLPADRTNIASRKEVDTSTKLSRNITIKYPIVVSPMDTISDVEMCIAVNSIGAAAILHRFMPIKEQVDKAIEIKKKSSKCFVAVGLQDYKQRVPNLHSAQVDLIYLDTANGSSPLVEEFMDWYKNAFNKNNNIFSWPIPDVVIGNTLTKASVYKAINMGADAVRHGIGLGCFTPDMNIKTESGMKCIKNIQIGERVFSHTGMLQVVKEKLIENRNEEIVIINNEIECTKNHEIYVVEKKNATLLDENNLHKFAKWIKANDLTSDYCMIEIES